MIKGDSEPRENGDASLVFVLEIITAPDTNFVTLLSRKTGGTLTNRSISYKMGEFLGLGLAPYVRFPVAEGGTKTRSIKCAQLVNYKQHSILVLPQFNPQTDINVFTARDGALTPNVLEPKDLTPELALALERANLSREEDLRRYPNGEL